MGHEYCILCIGNPDTVKAEAEISCKPYHSNAKVFVAVVYEDDHGWQIEPDPNIDPDLVSGEAFQKAVQQAQERLLTYVNH